MSDSPQEERKALPRGLLIGGIVVIGLVLACAVCVVVLSAVGVLAGAGLPAIPGLAASTPTPVPTPAPQPTPTEDLDLSAPPTVTLNNDGWRLHDSYESHYSLVVEADGEVGTFDIDIAANGDGENGLTIVQTSFDATEEPELLHVVFLSDAAYVERGSPGDVTCTVRSYDALDEEFGDDASFDAVLEEQLGTHVDTFLESLPELERVMPNETINGVESRHYAAQGASFPVGGEADGAAMVSATIDAWVAREGEYPIRIEYGGDLSVEGQVEGRFSLTFDLLSRNQPVSLEPPASCQ